MGTAKMVIPVSDLGWEDEDTRVVEDAPMPSLAVPPLEINRTMRLEKVDPALLARARTSLPPRKKTSLPPKRKTSLPPAKAARPLPPRPGAKADASVTPRPTPPRPLAVKPFVHRPFAIPAPLPRARPGLPTAAAKSSAEVVPSLFAMDLEATSPFAAKIPVDEAPPSSRSFGTIPAPPPSMTGAIIVDEKMFEDAVGGRIHMNGASLIPSNIDLGIVIEPTGTIDVDETWLEDEDVVEQDIEPESFWFRGKKR